MVLGLSVLGLSLAKDVLAPANSSSCLLGILRHTRVPNLCVFLSTDFFTSEIIRSLFVRVMLNHQAKGSTSSMSLATAYSAAAIGLDSFKFGEPFPSAILPLDAQLIPLCGLLHMLSAVDCNKAACTLECMSVQLVVGDGIKYIPKIVELPYALSGISSRSDAKLSA
jgi:hypothetical protein